MDSQNSQTISVIEHIYNIYEEFKTFPAHIDEALVLFGLYDSPIHRVARELFTHHPIPKPIKKGYKGTYYYLVLTNSKSAKDAFAFRTDFFINQLDLHLLVERADRLKVVLVVPGQAFASTDGLGSFEYMHKEMLSFLSLVPHNSQCVGLVVMDGVKPVQRLLDEQSYQSPLLKIFQQSHLTLTSTNRAGRVKELEGFLSTVGWFETSTEAPAIRFYHHKHFANMNGFIVDFNQRLIRLSRDVTDQTALGFEVNAGLTGLNKTFNHFMDVILNIEFDKSWKRPLNLVQTLANRRVQIASYQQQFANNLNTHLNLLSGAEKQTGTADASYRVKDMEFFENKPLQGFFNDQEQMASFLRHVVTVKHNTGLAYRLYKLEKPFEIRTDGPSTKIYRGIGRLLELTVATINEQFDGLKLVKHVFTHTEYQRMINLTADIYKAEMVYIFIQKFKLTVKLLEPLTVFRQDFDEKLKEIDEKLTVVTNAAICEHVNSTFKVVVPQLKSKLRPKAWTQESITGSIRQMKDILKRLQPLLDGYFNVNDLLKFFQVSNTTVPELATRTLVDLEALLTIKAERVQAFHTKYYGDRTTTKDGKEALTQITSRVIQEFKAEAIAEVMKYLIRHQARAVTKATEKLDAYLNVQLRSLFAVYDLTDPDDWQMWRQQTKQPFERLHHLQDTPQKFENFVRLTELYCDIHRIERPEGVMRDLAVVQSVFDGIERELGEEIQTPIDTTHYWGGQIRVSHSYLLSSAGRVEMVINSAVMCATMLFIVVLLQKFIK